MSTGSLPLNLRSIFSNKTVDPLPFNLRKNHEPEIIFVPDNIGQIADIVREANRTGKKVAARCGGHSYASYGHGGLKGAWVLDLQKFDKVIIDHSSGTARIGAGNRLGKVALDLWHQGRKAIPHGLCPRVGIAGHSLHGGYGFTSRYWGLALDSIEEVQVVLPNGDILFASKEEDMHRDLFFGLLGAGSSFGIVTEFKMRLKQAPETCVHYWFTFRDLGKPLPSADNLSKIFKCFQKFAPNAPEKLALRMRILRNFVEITGAFWDGNLGEFREAIKPLVDDLVSEGVPPDDYEGQIEGKGLQADFRTGAYERTWVEMLVYMANDDHLQPVMRARKYMSQLPQFVWAQFNAETGSEFLDYYGATEQPTRNDEVAARSFQFLGESFPKPIAASDLPTDSLRAGGEYDDIRDIEELIEASRAVLNDTFFATSSLVKSNLQDNAKHLFEYIRNAEPEDIKNDNWFLIIDTYGGERSKIKHGDNRPYSCYSFRDHLFTMQFYISLKPNLDTKDDSIRTFKDHEQVAIKYLHDMRDTVLTQELHQKMYMCYVDPEDANRQSAEHYYDELNPDPHANPDDPDRHKAIYTRLREYKTRYDPRFTLYNPQAIGAEGRGATE